MTAVSARARARPLAGLVPAWASIRAALPAWLVARVLVFAAFGLTVHAKVPIVAGPASDPRTLQIWDVVWYRTLGERGYGAYGPTEARFFPLLPAVVAAGHRVGLPAATWLMASCWLAALAFAAMLHRLVLVESGDEAAARRAAWLIQLVPGANVLVLGYTEALAGALAVAFFLVLRTRRDVALGIPLGLLSGLVRPTGLLLAVPAAIELARPPAASARWPARILVAAAPLLGTASYLAWSWYRFGDALIPYRVQADEALRGGVVTPPWPYLFHTSGGGYPWQLDLALLGVTAVLLVVCARRLPASYTAWSMCGVAAAVTASGLHSLPRYLAAVFPLAMAAALATRPRWLWWPALGLCVLGFVWVTYLNIAIGAVP